MNFQGRSFDSASLRSSDNRSYKLGSSEAGSGVPGLQRPGPGISQAQRLSCEVGGRESSCAPELPLGPLALRELGFPPESH
jgi:hypothetical protein